MTMGATALFVMATALFVMAQCSLFVSMSRGFGARNDSRTLRTHQAGAAGGESRCVCVVAPDPLSSGFALPCV